MNFTLDSEADLDAQSQTAELSAVGNQVFKNKLCELSSPDLH